MKFITLADGSPDGRLALVSRDLRTAIYPANLPTLQSAIETWDDVTANLERTYAQLNSEGCPDAFPLDIKAAMAPLPRSWQWLDGSAFQSHGELMAKVFNIDNVQGAAPLMYQGLSNRFLGPTEDVPLPSEADGIDFEGEYGVIISSVPMGAKPAEAASAIRLIIQINDWSLRTIAPVEMKTGFGWVQAKPCCSAAPIAVTPDELGSAWRASRVHLDLGVWWNGARFGAANGGAMAFGFDELTAHAARTRDLCAGTIIGSGTVSNETFRQIGSSCIAERRGIELLDNGHATTPFMAFGDQVRMEVFDQQGLSVFGAIDQTVIQRR